MKELYLPLLLAAALSGSRIAMAAEGRETDESAHATIDGLVTEALRSNPELRFYEAELASAKAGRRAAAVWQNPELGSSVGHKRVRGDGATAEGVAWSVSLAQPFEWPGRIGLRKAIADREVELAELGLARFKSALAARVRAAATGVAAARQKADAAGEVAERIQSLREVLVQRDPAGVAPLLETRVIEALEITTKREASEAAQETEAALLELNQLRGAAITNRLAVQPAALRFGDAPAIPALLIAARTNNFELRQRAAELAQQGFRVALARNERFPSISAGPSYSEERAGERERIIGVGVSLPLPLWNRNGAGISTAEARQVQAEASMLAAERELERKVAAAGMRYQRKLSEMRQWRPDAVQHFREAADLADRHYRLGAVPVATYVELQEKYLEAVNALLDSQKQAIEAAGEIEILTGVAPPITAGSDPQPGEVK